MDGWRQQHLKMRQGIIARCAHESADSVRRRAKYKYLNVSWQMPETANTIGD
jgi:hypothetical protein